MRYAILALVWLVMCSGAVRAGSVNEGQWVALQVSRVLLINDSPAVLLLDEAEERYLLMFVDFFMANSIRMGLLGPQLDRPLTHDLIGILLRRLGARLNRITITELKDNTYYALISLQVNGETAEFDARPSDALAIAVRNRTPIFAASTLLKPLEKGEGESPRRIPELPEQPDRPKGKT
jgi:bifunctional DNase/RNase